MTNQPKSNQAVDWFMLGVQVAATGAFIYIAWRMIASPDELRLRRMRTAKQVEAYAMARAKHWAGIADEAAKYYEKYRSYV